MGEGNGSGRSELSLSPDVPMKPVEGGIHFKTCRLAQLAKNLGVSLIFY